MHAALSIMFRSSLALLATAFMLSGCGEFSYKRGANPADLESAKRTCMAKTAQAELLDKCLEQQGWLVHRFDGDNSGLEDSAENATTVRNDQKIRDEEAEDPVIEATYSPDNRAPVSKSADKKAIQKTLPETVSTTNPADTMGQLDETAQKSVIQKRKADPMEIIIVNSWWKLGNTATTLNGDVQACVTELGETHRPDPALQKTTRGLLGCMQKRGWKALRAK